MRELAEEQANTNETNRISLWFVKFLEFDIQIV
jgi:hypothetical protein